MSKLETTGRFVLLTTFASLSGFFLTYAADGYVMTEDLRQTALANGTIDQIEPHAFSEERSAILAVAALGLISLGLAVHQANKIAEVENEDSI